jgi:hypothetical protein
MCPVRRCSRPQVLLEEVQSHIRQAGMESIADVKVRCSVVQCTTLHYYSV